MEVKVRKVKFPVSVRKADNVKKGLTVKTRDILNETKENSRERK